MFRKTNGLILKSLFTLFNERNAFNEVREEMSVGSGNSRVDCAAPRRGGYVGLFLNNSNFLKMFYFNYRERELMLGNRSGSRCVAHVRSTDACWPGFLDEATLLPPEGVF